MTHNVMFSSFRNDTHILKMRLCMCKVYNDPGNTILCDPHNFRDCLLIHIITQTQSDYYLFEDETISFQMLIETSILD